MPEQQQVELGWKAASKRLDVAQGREQEEERTVSHHQNSKEMTEAARGVARDRRCPQRRDEE